MQDNRLHTSAGYALVRAFRTMNRVTTRALAPFKLSAEQAHILIALWFEGPMKVGDLQNVLALGSGTLTGAIDRMARAGMVRRVRDPNDARSTIIEPAAFDARERRAIVKACEEVEDESFAKLTSAEKKELHRLLSKLVASE